MCSGLHSQDVVELGLAGFRAPVLFLIRLKSSLIFHIKRVV